MQIVSLGFIKLSFIMFYRRIFCTGKRTWFSISTVVMGSLIIAWTATFFFVFLFYCGRHPSKEWGTVVDIITYCPNALSDQLALGISDSIMDVFIITMPIPVVCLSGSWYYVSPAMLLTLALDIWPSFRHC